MNLYVKQRIFSWGDRFSVYDQYGNEKYYVKGEVFSLGKKLRIYDLQHNELAYIEQRIFSFLPKYSIYTGENKIAEVVKEFTFFKHEYSVEGFGWKVYGDFFDHEYSVTSYGITVAHVSKEWFSLGDAYCIRISDSFDEIAALAVCLVIDACIDRQND